MFNFTQKHELLTITYFSPGFQRHLLLKALFCCATCQQPMVLILKRVHAFLLPLHTSLPATSKNFQGLARGLVVRAVSLVYFYRLALQFCPLLPSKLAANLYPEAY